MSREHLTDAQNEVLDQIHELLTEHFDNHVVVVELANVTDEGHHLTLGQYNGGPAIAMGLCLYQIRYIERTLFEQAAGEEQ